MCDQYDNRGCEVVDEFQLEITNLTYHNHMLEATIVNLQKTIADLKKDIVEDIQVYLMNSMTEDDLISHQYWDGRREKWEAK